ncbi:MAG: hypothetical protein ABF443_14980 [Acetobacter malorum]
MKHTEDVYFQLTPTNLPVRSVMQEQTGGGRFLVGRQGSARSFL